MEANTGHGAVGHAGVHAHEKTDAPVYSAAILGGAFVVLLVFGVVVGYLAFRFFSSQESLGPPASPLASARRLPPEPRLQVNGYQDWVAYQKRQQDILNSFGWVDAGAGVVRIPIDQAMDDLLKKGLPVRAPAETSSVAHALKQNSAGPAKATAPPGSQPPAVKGF
ncbi:MAG TPA: hypothetical protein VI455_10155 [Terriglobia bacterium]